jgi:hypothetical protein
MTARHVILLFGALVWFAAIWLAANGLPIYGLEDLGFVPRGEAGAFIAERYTAPGGRLPLNTAGERAPDARHRPRSDPRR